MNEMKPKYNEMKPKYKHNKHSSKKQKQMYFHFFFRCYRSISERSSSRRRLNKPSNSTTPVRNFVPIISVLMGMGTSSAAEPLSPNLYFFS